jgi:uncharacterized damage-inducible protein DinB
VDDLRDLLHTYLRRGREAVVWKLDGLGEYDTHRPLTPSATSLLGIVKHLANVEAGYFGATFGRPFGEPMAWDDAETDPTADMWATADESTAEVMELYERACRHADQTIGTLGLDAPGQVAWWPPERRDVTLARILEHVVAETHRHAGHLDIVRELIDGRVGLQPQTGGMGAADQAWWTAFHARVDVAAVSWRKRGEHRTEQS